MKLRQFGFSSSLIGIVTTFFLLPCQIPGAEEIQRGPMGFIYENHETPELALLRREFDFDEAVLKGQSEFERMLILKDWVFTKVDFKHNYQLAHLRNALKILKLGESGTTFHCSHFAAVYMQCALSLGWTARYLFLRNTIAEEHAVNEIWSNEKKKWIFIDVTWDIHIEHDGVPLSILEIREEWIRNEGKDLVYVFGVGENEERYTYRDFPIERSDNNAWIWWPLDEVFITYSYEIALVARNDFFSYSDGEGRDIWDSIVIIKDQLNERDSEWSFRYYTDINDLRAFYHDINRVDINITDQSDTRVMLNLDAFGKYNFTPNFKEFLIRFNGGYWQVADERLILRLTRRTNTLEARIRNHFDVLGPISVLKIRRF